MAWKFVFPPFMVWGIRFLTPKCYFCYDLKADLASVRVSQNSPFKISYIITYVIKWGESNILVPMIFEGSF